jgi:cephalosporin-C deacetylase-like acetyl esterase
MLIFSARNRFRGLLMASLLLVLLRSGLAQDSFTQDAKHFDYDSSAPLDVQELSAKSRDGVSIHEITYASPRGGRVSASLIVPQGKGKFAAILWGHWMMPHSPVANRQEFLEEAIALAPAGAVSLLIDSPQVREGFKPEASSAIIEQQVVDLRRGADLLLSRSDVDPKRMAYVGHSFNTGTGAILDAVDKRFAAFVFMSGPQSVRELILSSDSPRMVALRKSTPTDKLEQQLQSVAWTDAESYAAHLGPAPALFQYGLHDEEWVPLQDAKDYFAMSSGPKEVKYYDSDHALNAQARGDRLGFLREHLGLTALPAGRLEDVPQIK